MNRFVMVAIIASAALTTVGAASAQELVRPRWNAYGSPVCPRNYDYPGDGAGPSMARLSRSLCPPRPARIRPLRRRDCSPAVDAFGLCGLSKKLRI